MFGSVKGIGKVTAWVQIPDVLMVAKYDLSNDGKSHSFVRNLWWHLLSLITYILLCLCYAYKAGIGKVDIWVQVPYVLYKVATTVFVYFILLLHLTKKRSRICESRNLPPMYVCMCV